MESCGPGWASSGFTWANVPARWAAPAGWLRWSFNRPTGDKGEGDGAKREDQGRKPLNDIDQGEDGEDARCNDHGLDIKPLHAHGSKV